MHHRSLQTLRLSKPFYDLIANNSRTHKVTSWLSTVAADFNFGLPKPTRNSERDNKSVPGAESLRKNDVFASLSSDEDSAANTEVLVNNRPLNSRERQALKQIQYEYNIWKYVDAQMPESLRDSDLRHLLTLKTSADRLRYLENQCSNEKIKKAQTENRTEIRRDFLSQRAAIHARRMETPHMFYGMGGNFIFQRLESQIFKRWNYARLVTQYANTRLTIIHDTSLVNRCCFYDQTKSAVFLKKAWLLNSAHRQPAKIIYTGLDTESPWYRDILNVRFAPIGLEDEPIEYTSQSYTDLYPVDRLVYLTPDAGSIMNVVDEDKVYIISAVSDRKQVLPGLTLGEAKKRGIATMRLPIDLYVDWGRGQKSLDMHQVHGLLLDAWMTGDWRSAFQNQLSKWYYTQPTESSPESRSERDELLRTNKCRNDFLLSLVEN